MDNQATLTILIEKYNSMFKKPFYMYSFLGASYETLINMLVKAIDTKTEVVYPELEEGTLV